MTDIHILIRALETIGHDINDENASLIILEAANRLREQQYGSAVPIEPARRAMSATKGFLFA